jgi:D-alanyl-lipoteichoic acid acyltransferase DltB (MBOAT superfamily)
MNVTSLVFLALALVAALVFQGLPKRFRSVWLLLVSVAFLATWSWQFIIVLAAFGLLNYGLAIKIEASFTRKKAWLIAGCCLTWPPFSSLNTATSTCPRWSACLPGPGRRVPARG